MRTLLREAIASANPLWLQPVDPSLSTCNGDLGCGFRAAPNLMLPRLEQLIANLGMPEVAAIDPKNGNGIGHTIMFALVGFTIKISHLHTRIAWKMPRILRPAVGDVHTNSHKWPSTPGGSNG